MAIFCFIYLRFFRANYMESRQKLHKNLIRNPCINRCPFVRPSVRLLPAFLEIGSLVFSDFWHKDAKWQCPKCDGARFSKKKFFGQIWAKNCLKIGFFGLCAKLLHQFFMIFGRKIEGNVF